MADSSRRHRWGSALETDQFTRPRKTKPLQLSSSLSAHESRSLSSDSLLSHVVLKRTETIKSITAARIALTAFPVLCECSVFSASLIADYETTSRLIVTSYGLIAVYTH